MFGGCLGVHLLFWWAALVSTFCERWVYYSRFVLRGQPAASKKGRTSTAGGVQLLVSGAAFVTTFCERRPDYSRFVLRGQPAASEKGRTSTAGVGLRYGELSQGWLVRSSGPSENA